MNEEPALAQGLESREASWRARPASGVGPRVKICCMASIAEAWLAIHAGASALGFVSRMPSGPGPIEERLIAEIVATVPPGIATFLLTCETSADPIIEQQRLTRANTLQLVDAVAQGTYAALRDALPGIGIVQVIHVTGPGSVDEAMTVAPEVDALLLDSGNPALAIKELGGTGRVHDWSLSRAICERSPVPVYLAGGLNASNATEAFVQVAPFGLDVCSGVRTDGALDPRKLSAFMAAARPARV
ncbi:MAG: phosphoribosylanthranilate isomerase [Gemmatimonadaceae bacterium]|nr:phosphoribosylanthranilate isomerase [Gemmatimonadaceae bacterium]